MPRILAGKSFTLDLFLRSLYRVGRNTETVRKYRTMMPDLFGKFSFEETRYQHLNWKRAGMLRFVRKRLRCIPGGSLPKRRLRLTDST